MSSNKILFAVGFLLLFGAMSLLVVGLDKPVYFVPLLCLGVLGLGIAIVRERETLVKFFRHRAVVSGTNTTILTILVLVIVVLVNFIASRQALKWDLTENKAFTLSPQSIKVVRSLRQPVKIIGFFKTEEKYLFQELIDKYKRYSQNITSQFVDPDVEVATAKRYEINRYRTVIIEAGKGEISIDDAVTEEKITNGIVKALRTKKKEICFLGGHGEKSLDSQEKDGFSIVKGEIEKVGLEVRAFSVLEETSIPESCQALIIAGPKKPLFPNEDKILDSYVKNKGRVFLLLDPQTKTGLETWVAKWGVTVRNDVILDMRSRIFGADFSVPAVTDYAKDHAITERFDMLTFFPLSRSLDLVPSLPKGVKGMSIARTSSNSWGETNIKAGKAKFDSKEDQMGPLSIAVALEMEEDAKKEEGKQGEQEKQLEKTGEKKARLVVFGNANFANNQFFHFSGNGDLFLNTVSFLAEEEETIAIRPKAPAVHRIFLSPVQWALIAYGTRWLLPLLVVVLGVRVWWRRRKL